MRLRRNATTLALALGLIVMGSGWFIGNGTRALFTDSATSTANAFTSGVVDLKLTDGNETEQDTVTASVALSNMIPGDSITRPIAVTNKNGTNGQAVAARYAVQSAVAAGSNSLAERLDLQIGKRASSGTCDSTATFGTLEVLGTAWVLVYQGDLARASTLNLIGDPSSGQTAAASGQISGDRALAGNNGVEYLCLRVTFTNAQDLASGSAGEGASTAHSYVQNDSTAADDNAYEDLTATVTFTFSAEQTSTGTAS